MLNQILSFIFLYKYFALFLITFFASLTNLTPASPSLIASGSLIAQEYLNYYYVFLFGFLGSVLGDITAYFLSYYYSTEVLKKIGFKKLLNSKSFSKAEIYFIKNSGKTIFLSRFFLTSFGPVVNLIAGLSKISFKKFIIYDLPGEAIYVFLFTGIGYLFANNWEYISSLFSYASNILIVIIIIIVLYFYRNKIFSHK
ncbi:MAG: DedA family protein [Patescibacteria group bacterium]|nr:DedA family protein [Patescibacteria group bacterium]MDD4304838.1 DedA family protein [Patescibacteria group bacterium]MDD4695800.1 DedA family protein [Patescibacteria group bacterium]